MLDYELDSDNITNFPKVSTIGEGGGACPSATAPLKNHNVVGKCDTTPPPSLSSSLATALPTVVTAMYNVLS